jgi:hypothetical protein
MSKILKAIFDPAATPEEQMQKAVKAQQSQAYATEVIAAGVMFFTLVAFIMIIIGMIRYAKTGAWTSGMQSQKPFAQQGGRVRM